MGSSAPYESGAYFVGIPRVPLRSTLGFYEADVVKSEHKKICLKDLV
jgi:hypothetical protein